MPTKRTSLLPSREINRILNVMFRYDFEIQAIEFGTQSLTIFLGGGSERELSREEAVAQAYDEWKSSKK